MFEEKDVEVEMVLTEELKEVIPISPRKYIYRLNLSIHREVIETSVQTIINIGNPNGIQTKPILSAPLPSTLFIN